MAAAPGSGDSSGCRLPDSLAGGPPPCSPAPPVLSPVRPTAPGLPCPPAARHSPSPGSCLLSPVFASGSGHLPPCPLLPVAEPGIGPWLPSQLARQCAATDTLGLLFAADTFLPLAALIFLYFEGNSDSDFLSDLTQTTFPHTSPSASRKSTDLASCVTLTDPRSHLPPLPALPFLPGDCASLPGAPVPSE